MTVAEMILSVLALGTVAWCVDLHGTIAELSAEVERLREERDELIERLGRRR